MRFLASFLLVFMMGLHAPLQASESKHKFIIDTTHGKIIIGLYDIAPVTTENFIQYVNEGFYDGTIFHRVIPGFMIQGGGYTEDMTEKNTFAPIKNEADNGQQNKRGTLAMARTNAPDSATSQFFINLKDNAFLDYKNEASPGYAVFGEVIEGMEVVDEIATVQTGYIQGHNDVPVDPVVIVKIRPL